MPQKEPETLEEALATIEDQNTEIEELRLEISGFEADLSAAENDRDEAQGKLEEIKALGNVQEAAEAVIAETERPVGDLHTIVLKDTPAARRALRALCDAAGRP